MISYEPFWNTLERSGENWYTLTTKYRMSFSTLSRLKNGKDISIENYTVDGHKAAVVNYHDENEHDIAWVDKNDNLNVDNGEAKDIVTDELLDQNLRPLSENDNLMADAGADVDIDPSVGV